MSELLGKETIDMDNYSRSFGRNGNYSTNYQITGRELMTPDEVRMLDNRYALLFLRGERPVMDLKYDILKHENIKGTTDGGKEAYKHGEAAQAVAAISLAKGSGQAEDVEPIATEYEILTNEELEEHFGI